MRRRRSRSRSRPSRARGLKRIGRAFVEKCPAVAPFTGAWIETPSIRTRRNIRTVAPFTGAWIETRSPDRPPCRPRSRPSRARGLKPSPCWLASPRTMSRPSRARGLKLRTRRVLAPPHVAPFTGAWIETPPVAEDTAAHRSRPSRARGLKRRGAVSVKSNTSRALHGRVD